MNFIAIRTIYRFEMNRTFRTMVQSILSPVLTTSLYFIVFGSAIGSRIDTIDNIEYGAFIIPGLIMLSVLMQSITNASTGVYFPKFIGTIYEILSAPVTTTQIMIGYVGAAATKSFAIGMIILATATLFVDFTIAYPLIMVSFLAITCISFALFGFVIGILARNFEQLNLVPMLVITPLVFLGGSFYSISMLPPFWQLVTLFNPVVYLISMLRWSFYGTSDVPVMISLAAVLAFMVINIGIIHWIFKTGYRLKQ
ncbi:MAG: ABC transporter permease [Candidatus Puniceispirillaceae bacterium]